MFWDDVYNFCQHWGNVGTILGLVLTIVGFIWTIRNTANSRRAAQRAETAAKNAGEGAREAVKKAVAIGDLSSALSMMDEIKGLQRSGAWEVLPDRYAALKKSLIWIRGANPGLTGTDLGALQAAIQQVTDIQKKVEENVEYPDRLKPSKLNTLLTAQADKIQEILVNLTLG